MTNKKYNPKAIAKTIDVEELYDLDVTIARFILPRLMVFKKHCERTPRMNMTQEEWNQILDKMWAQNFDYRSDRTYLPACKELARYPKFKHVVKYLTNPDYTVKNRLRFLSFRISPVIWLRRLLKKEYKGV